MTFRAQILLTVATLLFIGSTAATAHAMTLSQDQNYGQFSNAIANVPQIEKLQTGLAEFQVDPSGRALVMTSHGIPSTDNLSDLNCSAVAISRLTKSGSVDESFARSGVFRFPKIARSVCAGTMRIDSRGRIVGSVRLIHSKKRRERILFRLRPDGAFDRRFGRAGILRIGSGNWGSQGGWGSNSQMEILGDDSIQVVTYRKNLNRRSKYFEQELPVIERFSPSGARARRFGSGGRVVFERLQSVEDITADDRGRIYLTGTDSSDGKTNRAQIYRLTNRGSIDRKYGSRGRVALGRMASGRTFQFESVVTLGNGVTFFQIAQDREGEELMLDGRYGIVDADGNVVGGIRNGWSKLEGANFGIEQDARMAVVRLVANADPLIAEPQFEFGVSDTSFESVEMSAPVANTTGGKIYGAQVSSPGREVWIAAVIQDPENDLGGDAYYGRVVVQHFIASW